MKLSIVKLVGCVDVNAAPDAGCQSKAAYPAPPADSLKLQGA